MYNFIRQNATLKDYDKTGNLTRKLLSKFQKVEENDKSILFYKFNIF